MQKEQSLFPVLVAGVTPDFFGKISRCAGETITAINHTGATVLLVEQMVQEALEIAHRGYVIQSGKIVHSGSARDLLDSEEIHKAYLGM
ncbi:MAG: hypothetical protein ACLQPD_29855 [Desulfomonilaceae bacterium]